MHRFFIDDNAIEGEVVKVTGSDFNHISHSLRMQVGDQFIVNNGDGLDYIVKIEEITEEMIIAKIISSEKNRNEPTLRVTLAQAIPKKSNMDLIVQKCTEIGISKIIPINTKRTIVKLTGKKLQKRRDRWQKIAEEAAKQSRRGIIPFIDELVNFKDLKSIFKDYDMILIPWEDEEKLGLKELWKNTIKTKKKKKENNTENYLDKEDKQDKKNNEDNKQNLYIDKRIINKPQNTGEDIEIKNILIIIGPEGGFTTDEVEFVQKNDGHAITLGPRILRTETAGFVALTALLYQADELGG